MQPCAGNDGVDLKKSVPSKRTSLCDGRRQACMQSKHCLAVMQILLPQSDLQHIDKGQISVQAKACKSRSFGAFCGVMQVWSKTHQPGEGSGESGAVARLHSALIAVLTHLVSRMGAQAASQAEASLKSSQQGMSVIGTCMAHQMASDGYVSRCQMKCMSK